MHEPSVALWLIPGQDFSRVMPQSQGGNNLPITYDGTVLGTIEHTKQWKSWSLP